MQGRSNTRMHKCRAAQLAGHQISQGVECIFCFTLIAMAGWQWKLMNELDRDWITTSFGWSKAGPTAAFRLAAILDGNIQLGTGTFLQTSPCVSFKWRAQEVLYNPVGLILHRNDPKANGASRFMVARPIAALTVTLQLKWVEESLMACQLIYLSGEVMIEKQYTDAACGRDLTDDIREHLLSNSQYGEGGEARHMPVHIAGGWQWQPQRQRRWEGTFLAMHGQRQGRQKEARSEATLSEASSREQMMPDSCTERLPLLIAHSVMHIGFSNAVQLASSTD